MLKYFYDILQMGFIYTIMEKRKNIYSATLAFLEIPTEFQIMAK